MKRSNINKKGQEYTIQETIKTKQPTLIKVIKKKTKHM